MKTRIIWTKIYDDEWFNSLEIDHKFLFVYYFTNSRIEHTGIYQCPLRIIAFETGIAKDRLTELNQKLQESKKVFFYEEWVYVIKSPIYGGYKGPKNELAFNRELNKIPSTVLEYFNGIVPIQYRYSIDTTINHKSEIIDNKSEIINAPHKFKEMREKLKGKLSIGGGDLK